MVDILHAAFSFQIDFAEYLWSSLTAPNPQCSVDVMPLAVDEPEQRPVDKMNRTAHVIHKLNNLELRNDSLHLLKPLVVGFRLRFSLECNCDGNYPKGGQDHGASSPVGF